MRKSGGKAVRYNKWGYIFLIPFIVVYVVFQLVPLITTIYNSFFENYMSGLTQVGPNFVGFENYENCSHPVISGSILRTQWFFGSCASYRRYSYHCSLEHGFRMSA